MLNVFIKMLRLSITEISRGGSVHRDSQADKIILPTNKPTREDASTDMYRDSVSPRKPGGHPG